MAVDTRDGSTVAAYLGSGVCHYVVARQAANEPALRRLSTTADRRAVTRQAEIAHPNARAYHRPYSIGRYARLIETWYMPSVESMLSTR